MPRPEVVLLQMGGPAKLDELRPFYQRLFGDPDLIQLPAGIRPVQPMLARALALARTRSMRQRYSQIGGGSPLLAHTSDLARAVERELAARAEPVRVHVAMRYSEPSATTVVADLQARGVQQVVLFPLYPFWSRSTSGSSVTDFRRAASAAHYDGHIEVVPAWGSHPRYTALLIEQIETTRAALLAGDWDGPVYLLLSAHGLPVRYVQQGDPYPSQVRQTAATIGSRVSGFAGWHLGFQSRMGPVQWLGPSTDRVLRDLAALGATAVVAVPFGFVSDHIETLYDLDILYRDEALALGMRHYRRVPSFNADPTFAAFVADLVSQTATEIVTA
jgi:protoporphyrin/coproporphyrin ferrochelatase